ncbi:MAG: hypothetical protein WBQ29_25675, partial [Isosphaeraceae bacterium]
LYICNGLRREIWLFSGDLLAVGATAVGTIPIPTQQASETGKTEETNPSPIAVALAADVSPHILVLIRRMPHFLSHIRLLGHIRRTLPLRERANR